MKCPGCGHETVVEVKFCPSCGLEMAAPALPEAEAEPTAPAPAQPPAAPGIVTVPLSTDRPALVAPVAPPVAAAPPPVPPAAPPVAPPVVAAAPPPAPPAGQPPAPAPYPAAVPAAPPPKKGGFGWGWACGICGCLTILIAAGIGLAIYYGGQKTKELTDRLNIKEPGTTTSTGPSETQPGEKQPTGGQSGGEAITGDDFQVTIPSGWTRRSDKETDDIKLILTGPEVNGKPLFLGLDVHSISEGRSLQDFSDGVLKKYRDRTWTEDVSGGDVKLCGQPARRVAFTDDDGDNLFYLCVLGSKGFVVTMISPAGTMEDQEPKFDEVLRTFSIK